MAGGPGMVTPKGGSIFDRLSASLNVLGSLLILAVMLLINFDVFGRLLFNEPLSGVPEMVRLSIVAIVFLQITHTLRNRRFIRSDVLIGRMLARGTPAGYLLQAFHHFVGAILLAIIFYFTIDRFDRAWRIDEYVGTEGDFTAPVWPIYLIILIGCAGTCLQFLMHLVTDIRDARRAAGKSS
tara:strand:+ start:5063 stop:5608 length:546 start_codon:yes stop_codon:yes gene_type:complete